MSWAAFRSCFQGEKRLCTGFFQIKFATLGLFKRVTECKVLLELSEVSKKQAKYLQSNFTKTKQQIFLKPSTHIQNVLIYRLQKHASGETIPLNVANKYKFQKKFSETLAAALFHNFKKKKIASLQCLHFELLFTKTTFCLLLFFYG